MYWRKAYQWKLSTLREVSRVVPMPYEFQFISDDVVPKMVNLANLDTYMETVKEMNNITHETEFSMPFVNYKKSKGNFFVDVDGNRVLDLTGNSGLNAVGYNHKALVPPKGIMKYLSRSPKVTDYPSDEFVDLVRDFVWSSAPSGLTEAYFTEGFGNLANETAIKLAFLKYMKDHNGLSDVNWDEYADIDLSSISEYLQNDIWVLSFNSSMNSEGFGVESSNDWPTVTLPQLKYPLSRYEIDNKSEEEKSLDQIKSIISERLEMGSPVGAIIIEPITAFENVVATPRYYKSLQKIAKENGIPFIVDETRTGVGSTGKMWAHEFWYLQESPDLVTFGTSAQISGVFTTPEFRPYEDRNLASLSHGDLSKIGTFKAITDVIQKKYLLEKTDDTGAYIKAELERINLEKGIYSHVRGNGTFLGWDLSDSKNMYHMHRYLLRNGILTSIIGPYTLGIRPSVTLLPKQAAHLRNVLASYSPRMQFI